jgi:hypothetical protein
MRVTRLFGLLLLPAALVAGGCTPEVPRASGSAAPVVGSPAPTPTPAPTTATATATPDATPTPEATPTGAKPTTKAPARRLGPTGWGALTLGMTYQQAGATGLIDPWRGSGETCRYSNLRAAPAEQGNITASNLGVVAIDAYGTMRTPEGIGLGSTKAAMRRAYPEWEPFDEPSTGDGRGYARVPGNSKATYRIVTAGSRVAELTLQLKSQNCYE